MKHPRRHSRFTYWLEMLVIRLRDRIRPPEEILDEAGVQPDMAVLDFGCGPGGFALAAARLVGPHGSVYALDVQTPALKRVRRIARRRGLANIKVVHGDECHEMDAESIDMILLYDVLHTDPAPESTTEILRSAHSVLKADGVLSVSDHHLGSRELTALLTDGGLFRFAGRTRRTLRFEKARTDRDKP